MQKPIWPSQVTWRSILLALALMPLNCYWSIQRGMIWGGPPTTLSLFYNVVFTLFVLTLLNQAFKRISVRLALRPSELLTIYTMLSLATAIGGFDTLQVLIQIPGHPFWFATPENEWQQLFWRTLPRWLMVDDLRVLKGYYEGHSTFYLPQHIYGWLQPVAWWTLFLSAMSFVMLCLTSLLRKQWTEREKLSYPIIQLPYEMTREVGGGFFADRLLWLGFAVAGGINLLNGLHVLSPVVPELPLRTDLGHLFQEKPWDAVGRIRLACLPFAVGLAFFIPLDLSFSCWFFFLFWKAERVFGAIAGWRGLPEFPYEEAQSAGAYLCIALIALWFARGHLKRIGAITVGRAPREDFGEPIRYPIALAGFIGGTLFLILFSHAAGMSFGVAAAFFGLYLLLSLAITRMRAELGHPAHELYWRGPDAILLTTLGPKRLGPSNLGVISLFWGFTRAQRGHVMPHQLEGFKLQALSSSGEVKHQHRLIWAMMLAIVVGALVSFWMLLDFSYRLGALRPRWGNETFQRLERWLTYPTGTDLPALLFMGIGFSFTLLLMVLKVRWLWLPLHPVAYPLGSSFTLSWLWFSFFLSWAAKWLILKHGGLKGYRRAVPFFLGLILGEFVVGGSWTLVGVIFQIPVYVFWH